MDLTETGNHDDLLQLVGLAGDGSHNDKISNSGIEYEEKP